MGVRTRTSRRQSPGHHAGAGRARGTSAPRSPPTEDAAFLESASQPDVAVDGGCSPRAGYVPGPYVPILDHGVDDLACFSSNPILAALVADCFEDASTYATCSSFGDASFADGGEDVACLHCLESPEDSDAGYGAVVQGVVPALNVAGCIQQNDESAAGLACAEAVQDAWACAEHACKSSCPVSDEPSREAYLSCTKLAAAGVCNTYAQAADACVAAEVKAVPSIAKRCFGPPNQALNLTSWLCSEWQG